MARRITTLRIVREDDNTIDFEAALWLDVTAARRVFYAKPAGWTSAIVSAVSGVTVTNQENTDLLNGAIEEVVLTLTVGKLKADGTQRTAAEVLTEAKRVMVEARANEQARVDAYNPWRRHGSTYDPATTTWTDRTIA